ncbi:MAG: ABC transporter ATP-binding protein [Gemmataceae bacterium]
MSLLSVDAIEFGWSSVSALADVGFSLERGAHVGVVGPNGAGKSTLLKIVAGFLRPRAGGITFDGVPLSQWRRLALARRLAYVPQSAPPDVGYTALEVVLAGRFPHVGWFGFESSRDREVALDALARVDASALADRPLSELSGGEQARILVARALAQEPDLLLLDEPTAFLDVGHRLDLYDRLHEENRRRGLSVLVVTHDLNMAAEYCDRVLLLDRGRLMADGPARQILADAALMEAHGLEVPYSLRGTASLDGGDKTGIE